MAVNVTFYIEYDYFIPYSILWSHLKYVAHVVSFIWAYLHVLLCWKLCFAGLCCVSCSVLLVRHLFGSSRVTDMHKNKTLELVRSRENISNELEIDGKGLTIAHIHGLEHVSQVRYNSISKYLVQKAWDCIRHFNVNFTHFK